jgi:sporulation protein YhbH
MSKENGGSGGGGRSFSLSGIKRDHSRFRDIVKGKVRQNLRKFISHGELLSRRGNDRVSIPVPQIDLPRFTFGNGKGGGVGQGEGNPGDSVNGQPQEGQGEGKAGQDPGQHELEADFTIEELAQMLGEELSLPNIEPKGSQEVTTKSTKYTSIHTQGPQSLRHFKRTFKEALKRQISSGIYNPDNPVIIPIKQDLRYRGWSETPRPQTNAVIIYMMDVSGSMGDEQKEIVRTESFWIDTWLRSQYEGIHRRFIIHDAAAKEVDEDTFYRTRESGGTLISSAYRLCLDMIHKDYPSANWNIYPFHFSDGDNWSSEDTKICLDMVNNEMLPVVNQFSYGQVESRYGSGQFFKDILERFNENSKVVASRISDKEGIYESIKTFLGAGR